jgi:hypothetical protein
MYDQIQQQKRNSVGNTIENRPAPGVKANNNAMQYVQLKNGNNQKFMGDTARRSVITGKSP